MFRLISVSVIALGLGAAGVAAQSGARPAETPPASFKGKQYVDSRGCVFIRAGFSGRISWVPRVTRDRKLVCGAQPSLGGKPAQAAEPPVVEAKVVKKPAPKTVTKKVVKKAAPKPKVKTVKVVQRPAPQKTKKVVRKVVKAPVKTAPKAKAAANCTGVSDFSSQFMNKGARCGSQKSKSRTVVKQELSPQAKLLNGEYTGPKGVNRRIAQAKIPVAKGYQRAYKDGRLNPLRGAGTASGKASMNAVWSNTVPRRLVDPVTGKPIK